MKVMKLKRLASAAMLFGALVCSVNVRAQAQDAKPMRLGMIGLDTSHVPAFAKLINDPKGDRASG